MIPEIMTMARVSRLLAKQRTLKARDVELDSKQLPVSFDMDGQTWLFP